MKNAKKNNLQGNVIASLLDMIKTFINSKTGRADMEKAHPQSQLSESAGRRFASLRAAEAT